MYFHGSCFFPGQLIPLLRVVNFGDVEIVSMNLQMGLICGCPEEDVTKVG